MSQEEDLDSDGTEFGAKGTVFVCVNSRKNIKL
jgi:hypothetical protein